jgi:DNA-binding transcriptional LysR family regulator
MDVDEIRGFVTVADRMGFSPAAEQLGVSCSALTRRVQRLEASLGSALFERNTRQVALSPAGRAFLPKARLILQELDTVMRVIQDEARTRAGLLALASLRTVAAHLLPTIIREFRLRFPAIHLRVTECGAEQVLEEVREGIAEFGFTFRQGHEHGLTFEPMMEDRYCLIVPPGHALAAQDVVAWHELKPHAVITAGHKSGNMRLLDEALAGRDWRPETPTEVEHLTTSIGLVEAGLGVAVVPGSSVSPGTHAGLVTRPLVDPVVSRTLGIFRRRNERLSGAADEFLRTTRRVSRRLRDAGNLPLLKDRQ